MRYLVTGCAGFIGHAVSKRLLAEGNEVVGLDNLNAYYDVRLKMRRLQDIQAHKTFVFHKMNLDQIADLEDDYDGVIHLAAQPGVRASVDNPDLTYNCNVTGFYRLLEAFKGSDIPITYASSSSVYGANSTPFSESQEMRPTSWYGVTKMLNEKMAESYAQNHQMVLTGLRFFTVYGPWGRPDMAAWKFTEAIKKGYPILVHDEQRMFRDFTYIDDIVEGILRVVGHEPTSHQVYNIGGGRFTRLADFIKVIEDRVGKKAQKINREPEEGEMMMTCANTAKLENKFWFAPTTSLETGIDKFVTWFDHDQI
jgi:UDP-glucuronate 4-epimerase